MSMVTDFYKQTTLSIGESDAGQTTRIQTFFHDDNDPENRRLRVLDLADFIIVLVGRVHDSSGNHSIFCDIDSHRTNQSMGFVFGLATKVRAGSPRHMEWPTYCCVETFLTSGLLFFSLYRETRLKKSCIW